MLIFGFVHSFFTEEIAVVILRVFSADFSNPEISHSTKEKSTEKIDGAVATIMALDRAIRCGNDTSASVYDDRGILFI